MLLTTAMLMSYTGVKVKAVTSLPSHAHPSKTVSLSYALVLQDRALTLVVEVAHALVTPCLMGASSFILV